MIFAFSILFSSTPAYALDWPDIFEPHSLHSIYIETLEEDWNTVRFDESTTIEVDAWLGLNDEEKILVRMRRKGGDAYPSEADPQKVSLRIDINDLVDGQKFHGLTKVNLENGAGNGLVEEGLAWYLHQLATGPGQTSTFAGLAAFVRVYVNGDYKGIYLNSEFRNKQFFRNRAVCCADIAAWIYKYDAIDQPELKTQETDSPTFNALCYAPFRGNNAIKGKNKTGGEGADCPTPSDSDLVT
jgi:spore coat protein CotH